MRIRKIREGDVGDILKIVHNIMGPGDAKVALSDLKETLKKKKDSPFRFEDFYVMEVNGKIAGAGGVWALKHDPFVARLDWFMIDPGYQRKGIGTMLIRHIESTLRKNKVKIIMAETSSGSAYKTAVRFWEKNGFAEVAKIPSYWEDGSACLYFLKRL